MNKIINQSIAQEIFRTVSSYSSFYLYEKKENKLIVAKEVDSIVAIKEMLDYGISVCSIIEEKQGEPDTAKPLINAVFSETLNDSLKNLFLNRLTQEDYFNLSLKELNNLYENYENKEEILDKYFSFGFDFKQGYFDEVDKALSGDFVFFEYCLKYKKDFDFSFKYEDSLTLDEIIKEEIDYLKEKQKPSNKLEGVLTFFKKAKETQILEKNLQSTLNVKKEDNASFKNKI
jgi:hypothetical protein